MKDKLIKFSKIYTVFILFALAVNLSMEILIPTPEEKNVTAIVMFYMMFNFAGSIIFLFRDYRPNKMGLLSFILGFALEFAFMRPDWVQNIYGLKISEDVIVAVIVSSFYWFISWGAPAYIIDKYLIKSLSEPTTQQESK